MGISTGVASLGQQSDITLENEGLWQGEEMISVQMHGMRMQVHGMPMERNVVLSMQELGVGSIINM